MRGLSIERAALYFKSEVVLQESWKVCLMQVWWMQLKSPPNFLSRLLHLYEKTRATNLALIFSSYNLFDSVMFYLILLRAEYSLIYFMISNWRSCYLFYDTYLFKTFILYSLKVFHRLVWVIACVRFSNSEFYL